MKNQTIGVEVEMSCISRPNARDVVSRYFSDTYGIDRVDDQLYDYYDTYTCVDNKGRVWKFMKDGSEGGRLGRITCEMVTPILKYEDIEDLQEVNQ